LPPVTWLRPIKPGVPDLEGKSRRFLAGLEGEDQVIFGVNPGSAEEALCGRLAEGDGRVVVVPCSSRAVANPKISRLMAMMPQARHERLILADAEACLDGEFARAFRQEWMEGGADVLTAGYRFVGMETGVQWLDAIAAIQTLWPGLELVRAFGQVRFTLGACTALRAGDLEGIGGWAALRDELAEDHQLGARLARAGKTIRLSKAVLALGVEPMSWREYWRHQLRVAVTYRVVAPAGAAGMVLTRGFTLCLLVATIWPCGRTAWNLLLAAGLHLLAVAFQGRRIGQPTGGWLLLSLPADVLETACWGLSWLSQRVWWGGQWRPITPTGQIKSV
jgi:ceramide glucosyltransferase